jgi:GNAT superfamily N-acetyltransferase
MLANAQTFIDATAYKGLYDQESMRFSFLQMMEDGLCIVDAEEDGTHLGGVGAIKAPFFFNHAKSFAYERFWWVVPGDRGKGVGKGLLKAIHEAAKDAGCEYLMMISLNDLTVDGMYKQLGFTEVEHAHLKRL